MGNSEENRNGTAAVSPDGGGVKHDEGKPRYDLLPWDALDEVVRVLTAGKAGCEPCGAQKYGDRNWERGMVPWRFDAALGRHFSAHMQGKAIDVSGHLHLAHVAACALMRLAYHLRGMDGSTPAQATTVPPEVATVVDEIVSERDDSERPIQVGDYVREDGVFGDRWVEGEVVKVDEGDEPMPFEIRVLRSSDHEPNEYEWIYAKNTRRVPRPDGP